MTNYRKKPLKQGVAIRSLNNSNDPSLNHPPRPPGDFTANTRATMLRMPARSIVFKPFASAPKLRFRMQWESPNQICSPSIRKPAHQFLIIDSSSNVNSRLLARIEPSDRFLKEGKIEFEFNMAMYNFHPAIEIP